MKAEHAKGENEEERDSSRIGCTERPPNFVRQYFVYWIQSRHKAYIGATVDPTRRLRQHNGEIAGGALRTRGKGPWHYHCIVSGFRTWQEALQYEWAAKYYTRRCRGLASRMKALEYIATRERWTSNSPLASEVPLHTEHQPTRFGVPPALDACTACEGEGATSSRVTQGKRQRKKAPGKFKRCLHGVTY
jgi:predicted GIY-YIG superfamily endonuclease